MWDWIALKIYTRRGYIFLSGNIIKSIYDKVQMREIYGRFEFIAVGKRNIKPAGYGKKQRTNC